MHVLLRRKEYLPGLSNGRGIFGFSSTFLGDLLYGRIKKKRKIRLKGQNLESVRINIEKVLFVILFVLSPRAIFFYDHYKFKFSFFHFEFVLFLFNFSLQLNMAKSRHFFLALWVRRCGRRAGLMVSVLVSGSSGPGSSPGQGHSFLFLGRTL